MQKLFLSFLLFFAINLFAIAEDVDPFEEANRSIYEFNKAIDDNLFKPVAEAYKENIPDSAQNRVSDFLGNLRDVSTLANQVIQLKPIESVTTFGRIIVNTVAGIGGLFDIATDIGLTTDNEDFGQTMAVWGVDKGPYIVLPIFGPSTVRDGTGVYVDYVSEANMVSKMGLGIEVTNLIDKRVGLLPITDILENADDPYIKARSSYLQARKFDVYDGDLPISHDDF